MITESFDNISEAIISPRAIFGEKKNICDTAIIMDLNIMIKSRTKYEATESEIIDLFNTHKIGKVIFRL